MSKWVWWVEPYENDDDSVLHMCLSVEDAIKSTNASAGRHGHTYENDAAALDDFIIDHWATISDYPPEHYNRKPPIEATRSSV